MVEIKVRVLLRGVVVHLNEIADLRLRFLLRGLVDLYSSVHSLILLAKQVHALGRTVDKQIHIGLVAAVILTVKNRLRQTEPHIIGSKIPVRAQQHPAAVFLSPVETQHSLLLLKLYPVGLLVPLIGG